MKDDEIGTGQTDIERIEQGIARIDERLERIEGSILAGLPKAAPVIPSSLPPARLAKFKFYRDAELRTFVIGRFEEGVQEVTAIHDAAIERFGKKRVPGRSSLHRFLVALREEVSARQRRQEHG